MAIWANSNMLILRHIATGLLDGQPRNLEDCNAVATESTQSGIWAAKLALYGPTTLKEYPKPQIAGPEISGLSTRKVSKTTKIGGQIMSKKKGEKKPNYKHLHPVSIEACKRAFQEQIKTTVGDTPPDTGSTGTQSDLINKTDTGFENYFGGTWKEGYPR